MSKLSNFIALSAVALLLVLAVGCGDDKETTSPSGQTSAINLVDLGAIIEEVAPPAYSAPAGTPTLIDSAWTGGDYPLLASVFGSEEPQSLYSNIDEYTGLMTVFEQILEVDDNGNLVTGVLVDSITMAMGEEQVLGMIHFTATVSALSSATVIPTALQEVLGTSVDLDYLVSVVVDEEPGEIMKVGITMNSEEQTILGFSATPDDPDNKTASSLTYASLDPRDSSFVFKGVRYTRYFDGELLTCAFNISSESTSDFTYRTSWFSNSIVEVGDLHCVIGGGNKDLEFAMKYRMFSPPDTNVAEPSTMLDQVFGPSYSEGTGLLSAYADYLDDSLLFPHDALPQGMVTDPWADQ